MTVKTRDAAIELLARFFREEEFATSKSRIAQNFDRMLADPFCWSALAVRKRVDLTKMTHQRHWLSNLL